MEGRSGYTWSREFHLPQIKINRHCAEDEKYKYMFSVEEVNKLVEEGIPFRDAYKIVAMKIKDEELKTVAGL